MTALEAAWEKVHGEAARLKPLHLRELFANDPQRFDTLSARLDDILVDFSKEKIDAPALEALLALARAAGIPWITSATLRPEPGCWSSQITPSAPVIWLSVSLASDLPPP